MYFLKKILFASLIACLACVQSVCAGAQEKSLERSLRCSVEFLSDTLCHGRAIGTPGSVEASAYILRRFEAAGFRTPDVFTQSFLVEDKESVSSVVGRNVVAVLPPSGGVTTRTRWVLVCSYYDGLGQLGGKDFPGADSNASGVAALLSIADSLSSQNNRRCGYVFAVFDGHNRSSAGAAAFKEKYWKMYRFSRVASLEILGSTLSPVDKYWKNFLIALGGEPFRQSFDSDAKTLNLHMYYDYYRSRDFTNLFYRKIGEVRLFAGSGAQAVMFTSGITMATNRPEDTAASLDYDIFARRVQLILNWLRNL